MDTTARLGEQYLMPGYQGVQELDGFRVGDLVEVHLPFSPVMQGRIIRIYKAYDHKWRVVVQQHGGSNWTYAKLHEVKQIGQDITMPDATEYLRSISFLVA